MFDPGVMLSRTHALPSGLRVRLRLPHPGDAAAVRELSRTRLSDLDLTRLLRADPRRRVVICATALIGRRETIVGIGALDLEAGPEAPTLLVCDESHAGEELVDLLGQALVGRARALGRLHAA